MLELPFALAAVFFSFFVLAVGFFLSSNFYFLFAGFSLFSFWGVFAGLQHFLEGYGGLLHAGVEGVWVGVFSSFRIFLYAFLALFIVLFLFHVLGWGFGVRRRSVVGGGVEG